MERGSDCVERNRKRAKIASVAEWKPPREPGVLLPAYVLS